MQRGRPIGNSDLIRCYKKVLKVTGEGIPREKKKKKRREEKKKKKATLFHKSPIN